MAHNNPLPGAPVQNIPVNHALANGSKMSDVAADAADFIEPAMEQIKDRVKTLKKEGRDAIDAVSAKVGDAKDSVEHEMQYILPKMRRFAKERPIAAAALTLLAAYIFKKRMSRR